MASTDANSRFSAQAVLSAWGRILSGKAPMLSIEITRECPLTCPGCYAYGENHLGGETTLRQLSDLRGDALVDGVLNLVDKHKPIHVSLVGGEPLVRHRELGRILPALSDRGLCTIVVTSGVIRIPEFWMKIPHLRVTVSVDGLPEHHDVRRKPATYERILKNVAGCSVNIHWVITRPMLERHGYLEEYVAFWDARPEVNRIWVSLYSPQIGEQSPEMLGPADREAAARELPALAGRYPKLLVTGGMARAFLHPPRNPDECLFAKMSVNYSADLETRVEPCIFGGTPDCSQCGCSATSAFHAMREVPVVGPIKVGHFVAGSVAVGRLANSLRSRSRARVDSRWRTPPVKRAEPLVQLHVPAPSAPVGRESRDAAHVSQGNVGPPPHAT
jgi:MoaA/NifB/PqqE/SkfB family radical SAM enzyme